MGQVEANGVMLEVAQHGPVDGAPLLLVKGLGSQLVHWPEEMLDHLAAQGRRVIVFDNRDCGLSEDFAGKPAYTLSDMAQDAVGVLDALGVARADVLGVSMGGMIVQMLCLEAPERLTSATIVMSTSGAEGLPGRTPEVDRLLFSPPPEGASEAELIDYVLEGDRIWAGPGWPLDRSARRPKVEQAIRRAWRPDGVDRQWEAIQASFGWDARLGEVDLPVLVIHGDADAIFPVAHAEDIASRIPGAQLTIIPGFGHAVENGAWRPMLAAFAAFSDGVAQRSP